MLAIVGIAVLVVSFAQAYCANDKKFVLWSEDQKGILNIAIKGEIDPETMSARLSTDDELSLDYAKWFTQARPFSSAVHCRWFSVVLVSDNFVNILTAIAPSGRKISWGDGTSRTQLYEFIAESSHARGNKIIGSLVKSEISGLISTPAIGADDDGRLLLLVRLVKILPSSRLAYLENERNLTNHAYSISDGIKAVDDVIDWSFQNTFDDAASPSEMVLLRECARKLSKFFSWSNVPSVLLNSNDLGTMRSAFTRLLTAHGDDETIVNIVKLAARPLD